MLKTQWLLLDGETKLNVSSGTSCDLLIYSTTKTFEEKELYVSAGELTLTTVYCYPLM